MNDTLITRLVVGEARLLALGRVIGQKLGSPGAATLRWSGSSWLDEAKPRAHWLARIWPRRERPATVLAVPGRKVHRRPRPGSALLAAASALVIGALAAGWVLLRGQSADPGELPVAALTSVRVLHSPYAPAPARLELASREPVTLAANANLRAGTPPLPITAPPAVLPTPRKPRALPPPRQAVQAVQAARSVAPVPKPAAVPSAQASARQQEGELSAVVLDEAAPRSARLPVPARPPETNAAASKPPSPAPPPVAIAAASAPAARRASPHAAQLIAITADGKLAVFTDPQTRLPQQFQLGEQLPGGGIIRSIDAKAGRVISSTKEYSLD